MGGYGCRATAAAPPRKPRRGYADEAKPLKAVSPCDPMPKPLRGYGSTVALQISVPTVSSAAEIVLPPYRQGGPEYAAPPPTHSPQESPTPRGRPLRSRISSRWTTPPYGRPAGENRKPRREMPSGVVYVPYLSEPQPSEPMT